MYVIKNTANDRSKSFLHRNAARFELEPSLGGVRIRLNSSITITAEHYKQNEALIQEWVSKGMVDVVPLAEHGANVPVKDLAPKSPEPTPPPPPSVETQTTLGVSEEVEITDTATPTEDPAAVLAEGTPVPAPERVEAVEKEEVVPPPAPESKKGSGKKKLF